jgi:PAS domain S-box-containing protein
MSDRQGARAVPIHRPPGPSERPKVIRRFTGRYLLGLGVLAALALGAHQVVQRSLTEHRADSALMGSSARQRVLAQRIVLLSFSLAMRGDPERRVEIRESADEMGRIHAGLLHGDAELGLSGRPSSAVLALYHGDAALDAKVRKFVDHARALADTPGDVSFQGNRDLAFLVTSLEDLSQRLDDLFRQVQREGERHVLAIEGLEAWILGATLVALFAMGLFVFRPMAARIQSEMARLQEAESFTRAIVQTAAEGIFTVDEEGRIASFNPAAERMFGLSAAQARGRRLGELVQRASAEARGGGGERGLEPFAPGFDGDALGRRSDGASFPLHLSLAEMDLGGRRMFAAVARDASELKRAEEKLTIKAQELARSNAELEQFAYVASHDLQEPLRMISSYTQLLSRRYGAILDERGREFVDTIVDGSVRMQHQIQDLLALSRVGTRGGEFVETDCAAALEEALESLQLATEESGARVTWGDLPAVVADRTQLVQLFQNLVGNAIKFHGDDPPQVRVEARRSGDVWEIEVRDNGIGIDPLHHERIFALFQRLHGRSHYPGTGMGLTICKRIVERHGGTIRVESQLGRGAGFLFTLPVRPRPARLAARA